MLWSYPEQGHTIIIINNNFCSSLQITGLFFFINFTSFDFHNGQANYFPLLQMKNLSVQMTCSRRRSQRIWRQIAWHKSDIISVKIYLFLIQFSIHYIIFFPFYKFIFLYWSNFRSTKCSQNSTKNLCDLFTELPQTFYIITIQSFGFI